jgi:hypothetical protein
MDCIRHDESLFVDTLQRSNSDFIAPTMDIGLQLDAQLPDAQARFG